MIIQIIIIILILICIKYSLDLRKFNHSTELIQLQNPNHIEITQTIEKKSPLIIHNLASKYLDIKNKSINEIVQNNLGYIILDNDKHILLSSFKEEGNHKIIKNKRMINDLNFKENLDNLIENFKDKLSCNINHTISLLKGNYSISLLQNKNNNLLFTQLSGNTTFYVFNPKHSNDIKNKQNKEIKKWGLKIILKPGIILSIPPEWYYIYECEEESVIFSSYFDSYFTYIYNLLK